MIDSSFLLDLDEHSVEGLIYHGQLTICIMKEWN